MSNERSETPEQIHMAVEPEPVEAASAEERPSLTRTFLRKFFEAAVKFEASDLLMRGGQTPKLRLRGVLKGLDVPPLDPERFEKAIREGLSDDHWKKYEEFGSMDLGVDLENGHRFRVNVFRTRGRSAIAARRVNVKILSFGDLYLPSSLSKIADLQQGLILIAGITGSGKSTTLASMLQYINERRACHIVTIEDPIEYLFKDGSAIVNQREVGIDVPDFATGMKALVRENPDVVLIGEMRDKVTFEAALQAAETGHLVFGTIHAASAAQAFGRIYDLFTVEERPAIRNMLAYQMQAFIYQKLLPTVRPDIQRVPAVEILLQSPPTRKYILDGREHELSEVIKGQREDGMQTFTDSLISLVEKQLIHPRVAMASAMSPEEVKMRLRGISSNHD